MVERYVVLLVEHDQETAEEIKSRLYAVDHDGSMAVVVVGSLVAALEKVSDCDVVLLDAELPTTDGLDPIRLMADYVKDVPMIVLTHNDEAAQQAILNNAHDSLPKSDLNGYALSRSVFYVVERFRRQQAETTIAEIRDVLNTMSVEVSALRSELAEATAVINKLGCPAYDPVPSG